MVESREFNSGYESKDKLSYDEFEGQYIAVHELLTDAARAKDADLVDIYTEKKCTLEKQNPLGLFKMCNKELIQLIGSPPDAVVSGILQAAQTQGKDYLEKVGMDLSGRLSELPENEWAMWDATSGMNHRQAEAYHSFATARLLGKIDGS